MRYSDWHRLRKYRRKKGRDINRWSHLYWRYHKKVYGQHQLVYDPPLMQWRVNL